MQLLYIIIFRITNILQIFWDVQVLHTVLYAHYYTYMNAFHLQGNIGKSPSPILLIFGYVIAYRKIRDTYFFAEKAI